MANNLAALGLPPMAPQRPSLPQQGSTGNSLAQLLGGGGGFHSAPMRPMASGGGQQWQRPPTAGGYGAQGLGQLMNMGLFGSMGGFGGAGGSAGYKFPWAAKQAAPRIGNLMQNLGPFLSHNPYRYF